MNIFFLDKNPVVAASYHCDKHVTKMVVEYAQLMCTAHRIIDGVPYDTKNKRGHKLTRWRLSDDREHKLYLAAHYKHPSNVWVRSSTQHYDWLYKLFDALCVEFTKRYGKFHKTDLDLREYLETKPHNLKDDGWSDPPLAMPDEYKLSVKSSIPSYRNFYATEKRRFATWKTKKPDWYDWWCMMNDTFNSKSKTIEEHVHFDSK